jgi:hypothetical protein
MIWSGSSRCVHRALERDEEERSKLADTTQGKRHRR